MKYYVVSRAVGRSENLGRQVNNVVGITCPLVEIGLTDLPKSGGVMVPPALAALVSM